MGQRTERAVLNHLIESCKDGERGFMIAATHVENPAFKALFEKMANQRARIAADLTPHAQRLGGDSAAEGTSAAALHRGWIDIKSRIKPHDAHAILIEAERGDAITVHAFKDALEGMLPPDSRDLVERLYEELRQAHAGLTALDKTARV